MTRRQRGWLIAAVVFSVVGLVGSTVAFAALTGSPGSRTSAGYRPGHGAYGGTMGGPGVAGGRAFTQTGCTVPSLPSTGVTYTAMDMGMGAGTGTGTGGSASVSSARTAAAPITSSGHKAASRRIRFSSSRTLPDQRWARSRSIAD